MTSEPEPELGPAWDPHDCAEKGCLENRYIAGMLHDYTPREHLIIDAMLARSRAEGPYWSPPKD